MRHHPKDYGRPKPTEIPPPPLPLPTIRPAVPSSFLPSLISFAVRRSANYSSIKMSRSSERRATSSAPSGLPGRHWLADRPAPIKRILLDRAYRLASWPLGVVSSRPNVPTPRQKTRTEIEMTSRDKIPELSEPKTLQRASMVVKVTTEKFSLL